MIDNFKSLSKKEKLEIINKVLDEEIRPFIAMDQGGVTVVDIENDYDVIIEYEGACVGCPAAGGSTLYSIQGALRELVHPDIKVIPKL